MIVTFSKQTGKTLSRMDAATRRRIRVAVEALPAGDVKLLTDRTGIHRLRIGGWRILFSYPDQAEN